MRTLPMIVCFVLLGDAAAWSPAIAADPAHSTPPAATLSDVPCADVGLMIAANEAKIKRLKSRNDLLTRIGNSDPTVRNEFARNAGEISRLQAEDAALAKQQGKCGPGV